MTGKAEKQSGQSGRGVSSSAGAGDFGEEG